MDPRFIAQNPDSEGASNDALLLDGEQWISQLPEFKRTLPDPAARMELAIALSEGSIHQGGGPFGAVITDSSGQIISCGTNTVLISNDCSAHAEMNAIRRACQRLKSASLAPSHLAGMGELSLYSSCSPCIMCFGVLWWSGISHLYSAADRDDANRIGFNEGPVNDEMFAQLTKEKKMFVHRRWGNVERAVDALNLYSKTGTIY